MGSERGVAMIWWIIILLVLLLAVAFLAYDRYSFAEEQVADNKIVEKENKELNKKIAAEIDNRRELSQLVGFTGGAMQSSKEAIQREIDTLKGVFKEEGQDRADATLEDMLTRMKTKFSSLQRRLESASTERDKARADEDSARELAKTTVRTKEQRITELESEKQQVEDRLTNTTNTKDQQIEELRGQVSGVQEQLSAREVEHKKEKKNLQTEVEKQANMASEAAKHALSQKMNNTADGWIVQRVGRGTKVFVNLGARDGVKEGVQFEVYELGKGNKIIQKGRIVIQKVEPDYSEAAVLSEVDKYDPIAKADLIRNPLFLSGKKPKFFLMGDMTGRFTNQQIEALIQKMGGEVVKKVMVDTTFLVLGRKESESAEPFENRGDWERAKRFNIEIIPSSYLLEYLGN